MLYCYDNKTGEKLAQTLRAFWRSGNNLGTMNDGWICRARGAECFA